MTTGRNAARIDASAIASTMKAMVSPLPSDPASDSSLTSPPPNSTSMPASRAGSALASSAVRASSSISCAGSG